MGALKEMGASPTGSTLTLGLKDMILQALAQAGGVAYLVRCAKRTPTPFLTLVGRVLPLTLAGEMGGVPVQVTVVHRHVTLEVLEAERIARKAPENGDRSALGTGEVIDVTFASAVDASPTFACAGDDHK
mgnify:CR=1 FL=1